MILDQYSIPESICESRHCVLKGLAAVSCHTVKICSFLKLTVSRAVSWTIMRRCKPPKWRDGWLNRERLADVFPKINKLKGDYCSLAKSASPLILTREQVVTDTYPGAPAHWSSAKLWKQIWTMFRGNWKMCNLSIPFHSFRPKEQPICVFYLSMGDLRSLFPISGACQNRGKQCFEWKVLLNCEHLSPREVSHWR